MNPWRDGSGATARWLDLPAGRMHYLEWGKPPVQADGDQVIVLVHGTGFAAGLWDPIASRLAAAGYSVLAFDRRGHGRTAIAPATFEFLDFADDVIAFTTALDLGAVHGVGHSAGATDLLLAAGRRPERFSTLVAMEPTIMDPDRSRTVEPGLSPSSREYLERVRGRRSLFSGREEAREHFAVRAPYRTWHPEVLELFFEHALEQTPLGLQLCCRAEDEVGMLVPILQAMERRHGGAGAESPFEALRQIACPVLLAANRLSLPYFTMTSIAEALVPHVSAMIEWELGHCAPMEDPTAVAGSILPFLSQHVHGRASTR